MRILHVVQKPQRRGAEIFAQQLASWCREQGHAVAIAYLYRYERDDVLTLSPEDVLLNGDEDSALERVPGVHPAVLSRLAGAIRRFEPDIVQVNGGRAVKYGAAMKRLSPSSSWRLVYRNIDSPLFWVRGSSRRGFYRHLVMPAMDGLIGVSEVTLREVKEFYQVDRPHVFIPNGVDFRRLTRDQSSSTVRGRYDTPTDSVVALFIGRLADQKRPDRFLRVLERAAEREPTLYGWLLGDGPQRHELERLAGELRLHDRVRFLGAHDDIGSIVAAADVYVSTSDSEGIPAVVLEASFLGLPTLAMRVGGMPECVLDGETGVLVEPEDERALADALIALAREPDRRRALGERARSFVSERFSMEKVGSSYLGFYDQLRGRQGGRRH